MESHLSPLQDIVRTTIRDELSRLEPRFQRITMSEDAAGKPAELYGEDGKIYYRKAGGAGGEIGVASGTSLWESPGVVTKLIAPEPIELTDDLKFDGDHFIKWYETSTANLVGSVYAFQGAVQRDFMVKTYNSGILTFESAAGHIACSGDRLSDVGTPVASGDAVKVDAAIHVPLAQLPLTSKGTVLAGGGSAAGVLAIGTDTHVLTLDSSAALGVKWAVAAVTGTNATSFIIDQDNAGAGVSSSLRFNRGSTAEDAAIEWNETDDAFVFVDVFGVSWAPISVQYVTMISEPTNSKTGAVKMNDTTGDMEFTVASGDAFVFKTV